MVSPIAFLRETGDELKKVTWPNQQEVVRLTIVVLLISAMVGLFIGGLDLGFTKLISLLLK